AGLIMSGLAAGESVLTRDEREMGVLLIELGGGVTAVSVFQQDALAIADVLPVGGFNCTNDLAVALNAPFEIAEEMKLEYGDLALDPTRNDGIEVQAFGDAAGTRIERREFCRYLRERTEEILRLAYLKIRTLGYPNIPPAGVVLTGGVANAPGIQALARRLYTAPIRIGVPHSLPGMDEGLTDACYASSLGSLLWAARNTSSPVQKQLRLPKIPFRIERRAQASDEMVATPVGGANGRANGHEPENRPSRGAEVQAKAVAWLKERARRVAL
ncbi:MAG: hypothetical protein FJ315_05495, partial [SAR202 cluster bacterium]|nr:hypothetical protein [SAR202 cluster bacterium]